MRRRRCYAVLTGDIVQSSRLRPRQLDSVRRSLSRAVDVARGWQAGLVKGEPEFFRGDAWQLLLADPAMAMRVAILIRASLVAGGLADSRVAVGLGEVERISSGRISLSTGPAFVLAGRGLDEMTRYSRMTIGIPESAGRLSGWVSVAGHLCDSLIGQWTRRQAEMVRAAIDPREPDYEKIGRALRPAVSKQAVAKGLGGANWHSIREALRLFEGTPWEATLQHKVESTINGCLAPDNHKRLTERRQP
jgi:hypothetical protein